MAYDIDKLEDALTVAVREAEAANLVQVETEAARRRASMKVVAAERLLKEADRVLKDARDEATKTKEAAGNARNKADAAWGDALAAAATVSRVRGQAAE